jgi:hypothetical protein
MASDLLMVAERTLKAAQAILQAGIESSDTGLTVAGIREVRGALELVAKLQPAGTATSDDGGDYNATLDRLLADLGDHQPDDPWVTTAHQLQLLRDNGPEKTAWQDPELKAKADRVLLMASAALGVWGYPSDVVGEAPVSGPVGLPDVVDDAVVVEDADPAEMAAGASTGSSVRALPAVRVEHSDNCRCWQCKDRPLAPSMVLPNDGLRRSSPWR